MGNLGPLEFNPRTGEPFLRLRQHPNIILTPPREDDIPYLLPPLNDDRVHIWLAKVPFPYTSGDRLFSAELRLKSIELNTFFSEHARNWLNQIIPDCAQGLKELTNNSPFLSQSPVRYLREIQADGSELFVGDIGFIRCPDIPFENSKHDNETNLKLPPGDPNIVWTIGDWVTPSHQRKGIMTDAVDTLINEIAKPLMGARHLTASTYTANEGSKKVFLKNGFSVVRCIENYAEVKGYQRDLIVMERHDD